MFKAAIRVNKITSIAQLRGATLHAERGDETSQARLREGAERGLMPEGAESYAKPFSATCIRQ